MKFFHLADLHIGKRVHGFSMLKDQEYVLNQILALCDSEKPDVVLLAGDIYDKAVPAAEGVTVLDDFLTELHRREIPVCLVSGNHDSPERLSYGGRILEKQGIYLAGNYRGETSCVRFSDAFGEVRVWLLPFVRPSSVRPYAPQVTGYEEAVAEAVRRMEIDRTVRNVLVAHQFVTNGDRLPGTCDSEELSVGTLEQVDVSVFEDFDYVALGHLHGPQSVGRDSVRYAGSPLKYSFSEVAQHKSVTVVTLSEKGKTEIRTLPLTPLHEMRQLRGPLEELLRAASEETREGYIAAVLTDEGEVYDALGRLRNVYPNLMQLEFARESERVVERQASMERMRSMTASELFAEFYERQRQRPLGEEKLAVVEQLLEKIQEDRRGGDDL